jgi:general secretion pathway protein K
MSAISGERDDSGAQRGMVLVIVLWIVALLAVMAGGFAYSMRVETRLATSAVERAQARALAEAGVAYAQAWQLDHEASRKIWPPNGDPHEWSFGGGRLRIQVTDANGLVNLNNADPKLLETLFAGVGLEGRDRDQLVQAILDWRESDQDRLSMGAGRAERRPGGRLRPKKARFESIEELQQIEGITKEIYERIANEVTVFSNHVGVNPEFASVGLLRNLGLDERTVADYIAARARAVADGSPLPPLPQSGSQIIFSGGRANVYHVAVTAEMGAGTTVTVKAVTDVQGTVSGQDLRVLAWREGR